MIKRHDMCKRIDILEYGKPTTVFLRTPSINSLQSLFAAAQIWRVIERGRDSTSRQSTKFL